jgi:hypothetical protein
VETGVWIIVKPSQREPRDALSSGWSSQAKIVRLQRRYVVELEPMIQLHRWLDEKRTARAACRLMGDSRTGKTIACDAVAFHALRRRYRDRCRVVLSAQTVIQGEIE